MGFGHCTAFYLHLSHTHVLGPHSACVETFPRLPTPPATHWHLPPVHFNVGSEQEIGMEG